MPGLSLYFDYRSPYAYLAHTRLRQSNIEMSYHPFDVRDLMERVGNVPTSVTCKAKNRYVQLDLRRWAAHYVVRFQRHPDILKIDFKRLLRATLCAADRQIPGDAVAAIFDAVWGEPKPLDTPSDIAALIRRTGADSPTLEADMDETLWDAALDQATIAAADRGVFGAPCMFVGDELFFGNDRVDFVRAALEKTA